jgi:hypothetical protein
MRPVRLVLAELPPTIREKALKNLNPNFKGYRPYVESIADAVEFSFDWEDSPEGFDFWSGIHEDLIAMEEGDNFNQESEGLVDILNGTDSDSRIIRLDDSGAVLVQTVGVDMSTDPPTNNPFTTQPTLLIIGHTRLEVLGQLSDVIFEHTRHGEATFILKDESNGYEYDIHIRIDRPKDGHGEVHREN